MSTPESSAPSDRDHDGAFSAVQFIRTRRLNLREHTDAEIAWWISSFTAGSIADYQMTAWLMAVCLNGLSARETATLTRCMMESGVRVAWRENVSASDEPIALVDKHSSGGIGDKGSIILAPLVASFGVLVPMMAGRGLGHTGGTIDKLESIPGFSTSLSVPDFQRLVRSTGCVITAAGPTLCPADQKMYALRDVSDTVSSVALQTASIMSKKIAENPDTLVLDVKYGVGAFQTDREQAEALAKSMVLTGEANGLCPTTAFLTRMDHPIGRAVGNWLEVQECIDIMKGWTNEEDVRLSQDLITLVVYQAAQMLYQTNRFPDQTFEQLVTDVRHALRKGQAMPKFLEMVAAQGGDATVILSPDFFATTHKPKAQIRARQTGYVSNINALTIGQVSVLLGAGRRVAGQPVDPFAGIWFYAQVGDYVTSGSILADVYHEADMDDTAFLHLLEGCIEYSEQAVQVPSIITSRITKDGTEEIVV